MMKRFIILFLFMGVSLLSSCTTTRHPFDYDREVDFSRLKTFNWLPDDEKTKPAVKNRMIDKRFKRAIKAVFEFKGYSINTESPDFLVAYDVSVRERKHVMSLYNGYFFHGYFHHNHFFHSIFPCYEDYYVESYDEATIIIDILDASRKELIWRGWKSEPLSGPSISEKRITQATEKILRNFPP